MFLRVIEVFALFSIVCESFHFQYDAVRKYSRGIQSTNRPFFHSRNLATTMSDAPVNTKKKGNSTPKDLSGFSVGQEFEGKVVSVKQFGAFVEVEGGVNVLLPRSLLTKGNFAKLSQLASTKSKETVRVELLSVSQQNQTVSGKYVSGSKELQDLSKLEEKDYAGKAFNATVCGVHDFGIFAELDDFGVEGLIPSSRLPETLPGNSVAASFP